GVVREHTTISRDSTRSLVARPDDETTESSRAAADAQSVQQRAVQDRLDGLVGAVARLAHVASALEGEDEQLAQPADDDDGGVHRQRPQPELRLGLTPGF